MAARWAALAARLTLTRYLAASMISLCADMGLFLGLVAMGMGASWAALAGYGTGIAVHWSLSVRFVFAPSVTGGPTHGQRTQFLLSALMGLAITVGMVSLLTALGFVAALAKGMAVIVSFTTVYLVRKHVVFGAR